MRSALFSSSYILLSEAVKLCSFGMGSIRKLTPRAISSSSLARSADMSCTFRAPGRKFTREFLRLRSRSFLSHTACFVSSRSSATEPWSPKSISSGASVMRFSAE